MEPFVLYEDNHLLVVDKPAGMLSQADETGDEDVVTWAKAYLKEKYQKPGNVFAGLVHRLDRPASGVMVLARTSKAAARLTAAFGGRDVDKRYLALVEGLPEEEGRAEDLLIKVDRKARVVGSRNPEGKKAALTWKLLGADAHVSLVEVRLETGRAHQIRVQMGSRKFPLVGDLKYGARKEFDGKNLALHAFRLTLEHPTLKESMTWEARLPKTWPQWCREMVASPATPSPGRRPSSRGARGGRTPGRPGRGPR